MYAGFVKPTHYATTPLYGLRVRLLAVILFVFLPVFSLALKEVNDQRSYVTGDAWDDSVFLAQVITREETRHIEAARQLLVTLSILPVVRDNDLARCNTLFADLLTQYNQYTNIALLDLNGNTLCSSLPATVGLNFQQESWFPRMLETPALQVGDYRIGQLTGRPVIPIAYPVFNERGEMQSIVSITLALDWLESALDTLDLPREAELTVLQNDGTILVHHPDNDKIWTGALYHNQTVLEAALSRSAGTMKLTDEAGERMLYYFTPFHLESHQAYIITGVKEKTVLAPVRESRNETLMGLGGVIFMVVVVALVGSNMIVNPVNRLVRATRTLAEGDLTTRVETGSRIVELNQLAEAFNVMADSVEKRVEERTRALMDEIRQRKRAESELEKYTARLRESNAELENFAHIASHDLQEPLRKVKTFGSRIQQKYGHLLDEQGLDYLNRMQESANRMQQLIRDLLSYAQVTRQAKPFAPVDLNQVVKEVVNDLEPQIESRGGKITVQPLPVLEGDALQFRQLFQNLISNAIKYHRPDALPEIRIYAHQFEMKGVYESPGGEVAYHQIVVEDNGIGFDKKYVERIFGLFERLHGRSDYEGTGIGLAICRKIVERYNGTITATSEPGKGSQFIVTLPAKLSV